MKHLSCGVVVLLALAGAAEGQSLSLSFETSPSLADGVLDVGETAGFTIRVEGEGGSEPYRALAALYGFTLSGFAPGTFTQTGQNHVLTSLPGSPGLVYDGDAGTITMQPTGGFVQLAGILPTDNANPVYLFSFDWVPASYDFRGMSWTIDATHGSVYVGGDASDPASWLERPVDEVAHASGSFWMLPSPSSAALLGIGGLAAARRRRG